MSEPFIAEIRIFAGNFAPRNWSFCDGQLLPISQNTALFSLIGTTYGGDGRTTTALPNLQGRAPMHPGNGSGLTLHRLGESGGAENITLSSRHLPSHSHNLKTVSSAANITSPTNHLLAASEDLGDKQYATSANMQDMHTSSIIGSGGSQPHNNMPPGLAMNFIIALTGLYPSRS